MLITCPGCQANYTVADEKVRGRSLTVRCRSCQASINLDRQNVKSLRPVTPPAIPSAHLRAAAAPAPRRIDEASQMFTLAALVGRATGPQSEANTKRASLKDFKKESSGVIDLNALARAAEERAKRAQSEPPPSAFAREARSVSDAAPPASRRLRFAAIAAAAGVLAIVGIVAAMSGGEEPKARVAVATQAAPEAPKAEPAAVATPAPAASPVAAAAPVQDATPARAPKHGAKFSAGAWHSKGKNASVPGPKMSKVTSGGFAAKTSDPAPAPKAKPTAASDPCGCKGNLQCAIKCFK